MYGCCMCVHVCVTQACVYMCVRLNERMFTCVCLCVFMCVCVYVGNCVCVRVSMCVSGCVLPVISRLCV